MHSAEALLLARYFMYSQVYFHHTRKVYDFHLTEFLAAWLPGGRFPTDAEGHLGTTDNEVLVALRHAAREPAAAGHDHARRIAGRDHSRLLYRRNPLDVEVNPQAAEVIARRAGERYGPGTVHQFTYTETSRPNEFPILLDGRVVSSRGLSPVMSELPVVSVDYVFVDPAHRSEARSWLADNREKLLAEGGGADA